MNKLVCFHLFNDFSGSPKVLRMLLGGLAEKGWQIDLVTSKGEGALSDLTGQKGIHISKYAYRFSDNGIVTMLRYCRVQLYVFLLSFRYLTNRNTVFYINTILPVGAALAGKLMGKRVVYHYHEDAGTKGLFYRMLAKIMQELASDIICVSAYQQSFLKRKKRIYIVPNAVPENFIRQLKPNPNEAFERKRVLMLGSLKQYKGTLEFIELAERLKKYSFELVLNETPENIAAFWKDNGIEQPANLTVHHRQNNVAPFYNRASIVLNLSNKELFIETFGLTALEAMSAGLPVIVPTVGGIAEMVEDGYNGYKADVQILSKIEHLIRKMLTNKDLYLKLSCNALLYSKRYDTDFMTARIRSIIETV